MSRAARNIENDDRSRKEILREMACEDPDENPAVVIYREKYKQEYGETPWKEDDS